MAKQPFIINKIDNKHKCIKSNYGHMEVKYSNGYCTLYNDWEHRLLHPLSQHCWDMLLDILLMWWKFNLITLPHHKMLQPWAFNIHKECHMPFNNQSYHIFNEHLLTKITCLLRNWAREKHNNCVWNHNLPFCPFCLPSPISYVIWFFVLYWSKTMLCLLATCFFMLVMPWEGL